MSELTKVLVFNETLPLGDNVSKAMSMPYGWQISQWSSCHFLALWPS